MTPRLGDLVGDPALELAVVVGGPAALELPVTGAFITDLPDPSPFLSPGLLVLSSGLWVERADGVERFTAALATAGVSALVLGLIEHGQLPPAVVEACERRGIALLTIGDGVSFTAVTDAARDPQVPRSAQELTDRVTRAVAEGRLHDALALVSTSTGLACWIVDATGALVVASPPTGSAASPPLSERVGAAWHAALALTAPTGPVRAPLHPPAAVWQLGQRAPGPRALLVADVDAGDLDPHAAHAFEALALVAGPHLRFAEQVRSHTQQHTESLLAGLAAGSADDGEVSALLRVLGLDPSRPLRVVVADVADVAFSRAAVLAVLEEVVGGPGVPTASCLDAGRPVVVVDEAGRPDSWLADRVRSRESAASAMLGGRQLRVGASDPARGVRQLASAVAAATDRLVAAATDRLSDAAGHGPIVLVDRSTADSHRSLLRALGEPTRAAFAARVLGPVLAYDARHGGDLVPTLTAYFRCGSSWQEAADELHVHPNTVRYRLSRIEALTGRDVSRTEDRVDLFLALACHR